MNCRIGPICRQRGFTLVELIITLVILAILATVGSSMLGDSFRTARTVNAGQASANEVRYAVERLSREIREVKYISKAAGYDITSTIGLAQPGITFARTISGADVTVNVAKSGANLTLAYSSPAVTSTLANQASAFTVDLRKLDNAAATSTTDVRFVVISLTVVDATSGQAITERTRVALRNQ